ncbi:MAG: hypothetical protein KUG79_13960 [Pseudomonadales bacterium]|nr:hypothetical protein [Pseudomonadales bacterium]
MNLKQFKNRMLLPSAILVTFLSVYPLSSPALDATSAASAVENGVSLLESTQDITEGGWGKAEGLDYIYTAASVEALKAANQRTGSYYSGIAWLENQHANNVDLKARKIVALVERGNNITPDLDIIQASKREASQGGWGLSAGYYNSPLESALVLQALSSAADTTGQNDAIAYLVDTQLNDGGWSTAEATSSDYWITAEIVLALVSFQGQTGVSTAMSSASSFLSGMSTSINNITLSRVALALFQLNGLTTPVDNQMSAILVNQVTAGDWGGVLATSSAITALSYAVGLNTLATTARVSIDEEQLRTAINTELGYAAYGHITQSDIANVTSLDLRTSSVANLNGLQGASGLTSIKVNASTDLSAISGLSGITIFVDSDSDDIADGTDNCPNISNSSQTNLDGDAFGDLCDSDIDGDQMPDSWEADFAFNNYNAGDAATDADNDELINRDEYFLGTDPRDPDSDGDDLFDGEEVVNGLDPLDAQDASLDFDSDLLTNAEEIALGTDVNDPDTDSDNVDDGEEILIGRNPLVNEPVLVVILTGLLLN